MFSIPRLSASLLCQQEATKANVNLETKSANISDQLYSTTQRFHREPFNYFERNLNRFVCFVIVYENH